MCVCLLCVTVRTCARPLKLACNFVKCFFKFFSNINYITLAMNRFLINLN